MSLRLPELSDVDRLATYGRDEAALEGGWVGHPALKGDVDEWASWLITQWTLGWSPPGGTEGAGLIVDEEQPFAAVVILVPRPANVVEIVYGVAPHMRRRGIASRAVRLTADWALSEGRFDTVEVRIEEDRADSRRVSERAGFILVERFETYIEGTGQTSIDVLYARSRD